MQIIYDNKHVGEYASLTVFDLGCWGLGYRVDFHVRDTHANWVTFNGVGATPEDAMQTAIRRPNMAIEYKDLLEDELPKVAKAYDGMEEASIAA